MAKRKLKIVILPIAEADLREIVSFISQGSVRYARLEKQLISEAIEKLRSFPELGRLIEHRSVSARKYVFRNYSIIYRLLNDITIEILTIHHHARSFDNNPAFDEDE